MVSEIIRTVGAENIIALLLIWNVVGAFTHFKWEKSVNRRLSKLEDQP